MPELSSREIQSWHTLAQEEDAAAALARLSALGRFPPQYGEPRDTRVRKLLGDGWSEDGPDVTDGGCAPESIKAIVQAQPFQMAIGVLILLNTLAMCFQVDNPRLFYPSGCDPCETDHCYSFWRVINGSFLVVFVTELALRFLVYGVVGFFCHPTDWGWNFMDFLIVLSSFSRVAFEAATATSASNCAVDQGATPKQSMTGQTITLMRTLRILRLVRVFRSFEKLKMLARGLVESVPQVATVTVLLLVFTFIVGILATSLFGNSAVEWEHSDDQLAVKMYFGSVARSMFTLFQFLTLDDWVAVSDLVSQQYPVAARLIFYPYIVLGAMVVLSVFSGVMVDHMNEVRQEEVAEKQQEEMKRLYGLNSAFKSIFSWPDDSPKCANCTINVHEFASMFSDPKIRKAAAVDDIDLNLVDAKELFTFWDTQGGRQLGWEEFSLGLKEYRDGLSVKKAVLMRAALKKLSEWVQQDMCEGKWLAASSNGASSKPRHGPSASPAALKGVQDATARLTQLEIRMVSFEAQVKKLADGVRENGQGCWAT